MQKSTVVATITLILLGGLWIATNVSKTLADGTELNSTNIVTTYECATDATSCSLYNKGITSIAANTFINHTSLTSLSLGVNSISSIKSGDFAGTKNLTTEKKTI